MAYKCPLCLEELADRDRLVRFCSRHRTFAEFTGNEFELEEKIFCPEHRCDANNSIGIPGVFLCHVGCDGQSPFWVGNKVQIDGDDESITFATINKNGKEEDVPFKHWQVAMLKAVLAAGDKGNRKEMWFPHLLLMAMAEDLKGINSRVALAGSTKVGKTVIALQAMDQKGYFPPDVTNKNVVLIDYIFSRQHKGAAANPRTHPMVATLRIRDQMNKGKDWTAIQTVRAMGDLKAVFLSPSGSRKKAKRGARQNYPSNARTDPGVIRKLRWGIGGFLSKFGSEMKLAVKEIFFASRPQTRYTLLFYDIPGEAVENEDLLMLDKIEDSVNKIAVVINGAEIFDLPGESEVSIHTAVQRINQIKQKSLNCCLVVTQLDRVINMLSEEDGEMVREIAEDHDGNPQYYDEQARQLLVRWLSERPTDGKNALKRCLLESMVERAFFVWTADMPDRPHSYGLAKFICWCLNIDWKKIVQV